VSVVKLLESPSGLRVFEYRCEARPSDTPYTEVFDGFSLSYVARGSFGCSSLGRQFELVAGSFLVGRCGDEYRCSHEHHEGGDECLSFQWSNAALDAMEVSGRAWSSGALPPTAPIALLGALGRGRAASRGDLGLEEIALRLAHSFSQSASVRTAPRPIRRTVRNRRRAIEAALFIDAHASEAVRLEQIATVAGVSPFHFLRLFAGVLGLTPHQYLVRARLRRAAELLAEPDRRISEVAFEAGFKDLSNFVRTFHRAAGISPRGFQRLSRANRNFLQDRWRSTK
jgi:AraC-like DNA-binding protein